MDLSHYLYYLVTVARHQIHDQSSRIYCVPLQNYFVRVMLSFPNLLFIGKDFSLTEHHHVTGLTKHTKMMKPYNFCRHLDGGKINWITTGRSHLTTSSQAESPDYLTCSPDCRPIGST